MANKLYSLLILANIASFFICMTNYCEAANKSPKPAFSSCPVTNLRCSGNISNQNAIKSTQIFQAVANSTTEYFKALAQIATNNTPWAKNVTRARNIAQECTGFGASAVGKLTDCNKMLWNKDKAWNNTSKLNKTTKWIKESVNSDISAAMSDLETCKNGFEDVDFNMPDFLSASMEAAKFSMSQVLKIVYMLNTP